MGIGQGAVLLRFYSALPQSIHLLIRRNMKRTGYTPPLRRDLVKRLYFAAKDAGLPMTVVHDRLMEKALNQICVRETDQQYQAEQKQSAA